MKKEIQWNGKRIKIGIIYTKPHAGKYGVIDEDNNVLFILSVNSPESRYLPKNHFYCQTKGFGNEQIIPVLEHEGLIIKRPEFMPYNPAQSNVWNLLADNSYSAPVYCLTEDLID